jgi:hypothetical protein
MKKVCVNVSGLLCGELSPGHDEIRRVGNGKTPYCSPIRSGGLSTWPNSRLLGQVDSQR